MNKINYFKYNLLIYLSLIFIMLQDCVIYIKQQALYVAIIFIMPTILFIVFNSFRYLLYQIYIGIKKTPIKYIVVFIFFGVISAFFNKPMPEVLHIILKVILIYGFVVLPTIIFSITIFPKYFSYKKLLKFLLLSYQMIIYYGFLDFILRSVYDKIPPFYYVLCSRYYAFVTQGLKVIENSNVLDRASSIFFEPSFFATFIFLFLPFIYVLYKTNIRITKYQKNDKPFKLYLIIISWIALFMTKSPIFLVFCLINLFIFFFMDIIKLIKKRGYYAIVLCALIIIVYIFNLKSDMLIISRTLKTVPNLFNLNFMVWVEPSLATRIIATINTFQASLHHPIIGVGYSNMKHIMYNQYLVTTTPLTEEIIVNMSNKIMGASPNIFWSYLLQVGFIGTILIYTFFIQTILISRKIKKYFVGLDRVLLDSMILIAINYVVISVYWGFDSYPVMWFIFGILNSYILFVQKIKRKEDK